MATVRSDVLVLGGTLGGLVAATYLARTGLRVVLIEEDAQVKRPALLREPFLLPGLASDGSLAKVLRELALPLLEQREFVRDRISLQVVLPDARVDVASSDEEFAIELDRFGLAKPEEVLPWLDAVGEEANRARHTLWEEPSQPERSGWTRYMPTRTQALPRVRAALPPAPGDLDALCQALDGVGTLGPPEVGALDPLTQFQRSVARRSDMLGRLDRSGGVGESRRTSLCAEPESNKDQNGQSASRHFFPSPLVGVETLQLIFGLPFLLKW